MEEAPIPMTLIPKAEIISDILEIKDDKDIIKLNINIEDEVMFFKINLKESMILSYSNEYKLMEIKNINQSFTPIDSCKVFLDYLKELVKLDKIYIEKTTEKNKYISINFETEYLLKKSLVQIKLFPQKINFEDNISYLFEQISILNNSIKQYESENNMIKGEKNTLTEENKSLKDINKGLEEKINNIVKEIDNLKNDINIKNNEINQLKEQNNNLKIEIGNNIKMHDEENKKNINNLLKKSENDINNIKGENNKMKQIIIKLN